MSDQPETKKRFVRFHKVKCGKKERAPDWLNADEIIRHCHDFFRSRDMPISEKWTFNSRK
jgi:hypothetical protein